MLSIEDVHRWSGASLMGFCMSRKRISEGAPSPTRLRSPAAPNSRGDRWVPVRGWETKNP